MLPPMTTTTQQAEQLWVTAHEHVRRGDFASATRDLAACFAILQEHNDPRLAEVHRRWTEVHQLAVEEAAQGKSAPAAATQQAPNLEAEAEAAVNAGDLDGAIALYERALAQRPDNELIAERLIELRNARPRVAELTSSSSSSSSRDAVATIDLEDPQVSEPATTIVRDEAVERRIAVEPIVDDEVGDIGDIHEAVTLVPQRPASEMRVPQWGEDLLSTTAEAPITGQDPRWNTVDAPAVVDDVDPFADFDDDLPAITGTAEPESAPRSPPEPEPSIETALEQVAGDDSRWDAASTSSIEPATATDPFADLGESLSATPSIVPAAEPSIAPATATDPFADPGAPVSATPSISPAAEPSLEPAAEPTMEPATATDPFADLGEPVSATPSISPAAEQITGDDPRWGASATPSTSAAAEQITGDDPRWATPSTPSFEPAAEQVSGDDPRWGAPSTPSFEPAAEPSIEPVPATDPFADLGEPLAATPSFEPAADQVSGDDPRWGESSPPIEQVTGDDPRWGESSPPSIAPATATDPFADLGGPSSLTPSIAPAAEQVSGDDPRWGAPSTPSFEPAAEQVSGGDPRWGAPSTPSFEPAAEQVSGDDPRWGAPSTPTTAPLMAAEDAPVGMPSLDISIDMGASVSGAEADELPVEIDDLDTPWSNSWRRVIVPNWRAAVWKMSTSNTPEGGR